MVDFFADTSNFTVGSKLSDDVFVVLALAESQGLIDWLLRVGNNILETQWSKLVPLLLGSFEGDTMGIFGVGVNKLLFQLRTWSWKTHASIHHWRFLGAGGLGWWSWLLHLLLDRDLPEVEFFEEMLFVVVVKEFWEHLSLISEIVNEVLESLSVSIQENFSINFFEFVHTVEHLLESGSWNVSEDISFGHEMRGTTDVEGDDLAVHVDEGGDLSLLFFPSGSLVEDLIVFVIKSLLHVKIEPLEELVVCYYLLSDAIELHGLLVELDVHSLQDVCEAFLELSHTGPPSGLEIG